MAHSLRMSMSRTILLPKRMSSSSSVSDIIFLHQLLLELPPASSVEDLVIDFFTIASPLTSTSF